MLAIVIPYYKIAFFEKTLSSLAAQTNGNFTVYIGNDSSPENPDHLIKTFSNYLKIVYQKFPENLGKISLTKQWARCIGMTRGEDWIMIMGDDDLLSANYVEEFYSNKNSIENQKIKVVRFASREIDGDGKYLSKVYTHPIIENYNDLFESRFFGGSRSSLSEYIFRLEQIKKYGFRDLKFGWHADDLAVLEFSEFQNIYTINEAIAFFRLSSYNISRDNFLMEQKKEAKYEFYKILVDEYLPFFKPSTARKLLKRFELLTYSTEVDLFKFWQLYYCFFFKYFGLLGGLRFTRRIYLNQR